MKVKRLLLGILIILVALSLIAAAKEVYIKVGANKDVQVGKMGVHVTNSYYAGHLKVSQRTREPVVGTARLRPVEKMIDVRFKDLDGNTVTHISGTWYVFYNLTPKQMKQFNQQKLSIFYYDPWPMQWKKCYTWKVNGVDNRVACRIINFGLYGLGNK